MHPRGSKYNWRLEKYSRLIICGQKTSALAENTAGRFLTPWKWLLFRNSSKLNPSSKSCRGLFPEHVILLATVICLWKRSRSCGNHGFAIEKRRSEGILLCLVSRRPRKQGVKGWQSAVVDDSIDNWTFEAPGKYQSNITSLAQRPQNYSSEYQMLLNASKKLSIFALALFKYLPIIEKCDETK